MKTKIFLPLMTMVFLAGVVFFAGVCPSSGYAQETHRFRCCHKKNVQDTAVQTDTSYWQLVHPKTAKSGAIFRKGDMYVLDTNEWKFFTISDTTLVHVRSEASYKYGSTWGKIQFAELPEGRNLLSFLSELESEDDVEIISFRLKKELAKEKTPKFPYRLFRMGNTYIEGEYSSPVESDSVYVYYRNKSERELVKVPQGMSLEKFLDVLEKSRNVDSMSYYGIMRIINDDLPLSMILSEIPMSTQWGLERIYIQDAWDITMGDSNRTVAVLEPDGVDWSHYELGKGYDSYQNICVNPGEDAWDTLHVSGKVTYNPLSGNGTDDDGNGLTDDFIGWNFREGNRDCRTDSCAHGTGVAGIIAAKTGNGRGMKGIAGGNHYAGVKILPYAMGGKHLGASLRDAVRKNVKVANMSFHLVNVKDSLTHYDLHLQNAHESMLLVAASGNDTSNPAGVKYPAGNPNVMAVGAVDRNDKRWRNSCYGPELSVVAPGDSIVSLSQNQGYSISSGTSNAAPHVSGVATLMLSANPGLSPAQLRRIIEKTARKVGGYTYLQDNTHPNGTWNEEMGYGLIDAHAAVLNAVDSTLDLYVRDASDDNGSEPSACSMPWNSPDIWIEDMDGNEVSHLTGNANYYVCVRIHNRADHPSTGYEKLYLNWVKAGPGSDWSAAWTGDKKLHSENESIQLGSPIVISDTRKGHAIPIIPAGGSTVVRVGWNTPMPDWYASDYTGEELFHFCLCARIHDGNPIADEDADGINMGAFVRNSRKVAWKNISILENPNDRMLLSVYSSRTQPICLKYVSTASTSGEWPHAVAEIRLKPDADMYAAWQTGGMQGNGFVRRADSSFLMQAANAEICGLRLDTSRLYTLKVEASFPSSTVSQNDTFHFDLVQCYRYTNEQGVLTDETAGGEHFRCIPPEGCDIDLEVSTMPGVDMINFHVENENDFTSYELTDMHGNSTSYPNGDITVFPAESGCYTLCVTTENGCSECKTLCVTLPDAMLSSIYPNPADGEVNIDYRLSRRISGGTIQIISANGVKMYSQAVTNTTKGKTMKGSLKLSTAAYAPGQYIVRILSSKGEVYDSKTLIVK